MDDGTMNEGGRVERLEARVSDLEREVQRLSLAEFQARAAASAPQSARPAAPQSAPGLSPPSFAPGLAAPQIAPGFQPSAPMASKPSAPGSLEGLIAGRGLQIAGALLVLLGCAFFLDLAITAGWIGPAERILLGLVLGSALVGFGSRIGKPGYRAIGEALIGLGAGIVYLSLWASIQIAELNVPHIAAFAAMIAATAALGALAATRRSQATAAFGAIGGFLTPVLLAGGPTDRVVLAAYILVLAVAMLGLAARYAFGFLEALTLVGVLAYAGVFAPNPLEGWSTTSAEIVATLFFLVFAVAVSLGVTSEGNRQGRVVLLTIVTVAYATMLELIFGQARTPRGVSELVLSAALLGAAQIRPLDRAMARTYGYLALGTITLALASLIQGQVLLDTLTIEAGIVFFAGRRSGDRWLSATAATLLAVLGIVDLVRDGVFERANGPEVATSNAIWLAVAGFALYLTRDAKPAAGMKTVAAFARISFDVVAVSALTRACSDLFGTGDVSFDSSLSSRGEFAISAVWMAYGSGLFVYGLRRKTPVLRWEGLALLGFTVLKVFSVDLATVEIEWRVLSSIVLGGVLFAISALYARSTSKAAAAASGTPAASAPAE